MCTICWSVHVDILMTRDLQIYNPNAMRSYTILSLVMYNISFSISSIGT